MTESGPDDGVDVAAVLADVDRKLREARERQAGLDYERIQRVKARIETRPDVNREC